MTVLSFHCGSCNKELKDIEIQHYDELDGWCEECFAISMNAAYEDSDLDSEFPDSYDEQC